MTDYQIIDIHNHIYKEKIAHKAKDAIGAFYHVCMSGEGTSEDLIDQLDKANIAKAVVHSAATKPDQVHSINNFIYEQCQKYDKFIGFATLHPDLTDMKEEIERISSMGFKGIKLHPDFQEFDIDSDKALKMYEMLNDRFIILFHTGDPTRTFSSPKRLAHTLELFPNMKAIAAHMGGYSVWEEAKEYLYGKNVYIDTSSSLFALAPQQAADMIRMHGVDKVLFGTDYPMWLHEEELRRFMSLPLTEEDRKAILHDNAAKLLELNI